MRKILIWVIAIIICFAILVGMILWGAMKPDLGETGALILKIGGGLIMAHALFKDIKRIKRTGFLKRNVIQLALSIAATVLYIYYVFNISAISVSTILIGGLIGAASFVKAMMDMAGVYIDKEDKEDEDNKDKA